LGCPPQKEEEGLQMKTNPIQESGYECDQSFCFPGDPWVEKLDYACNTRGHRCVSHRHRFRSVGLKEGTGIAASVCAKRPKNPPPTLKRKYIMDTQGFVPLLKIEKKGCRRIGRGELGKTMCNQGFFTLFKIYIYTPSQIL
jgi:hypothetical protein